MEPFPVIAVVLTVLVLFAIGFVVRARMRAAPGATRTAAPGATKGRPARLGASIVALLSRGDDEAWHEMEELLLKADVGPKGSADLVGRVRSRAGEDRAGADLLADEIVSILGGPEPLALPADRLGVILVVGVNGSGKTTTIGKLSVMLARGGKKVSLAGSDTFRAAAGEQLEVWASRAGAHLVMQERGADPGAVAFDAVRSATARGSDVLIVDTAGRLHTKQPLMEELKKVRRVIEKAGATVDETFLVLDAQTGQNGIEQARAFTEAVDVTGVVLTKFDGSAKGGIVIAIREELGVPVRFIGTGERVDDLEPFDPASFADALLGEPG